MFGDLKMSLACIVSTFGSRRGEGKLSVQYSLRKQVEMALGILDDVFPTSCKE